MSQVLALLRLDFLRIRNWFRTHTGTKVVVMAGFAMIVAFMIIAEYFLVRSFFILIAPHEEFGRAVTNYSLNAAMLLLFLFSTISTISASENTFFRPDFLRFLLTAPIPIGKLYLTRTLTTAVESTGIILLLLAPMLLAYGRSFAVGSDFALRSLLALICLSLSSLAVGNFLTVFLVRRFGRLSKKGIAVMFILATGGSLLLMRFLFPPAFFRVYFAADWPTFQRQLGQLPLLSTLLPTNWLATTITQGISIMTLLAVLTTMGVVILGEWLGSLMYLASYRATHEGRVLAGRAVPIETKPLAYPRLMRHPASALLVNEVLIVIRSPTELTYIAFLSGLTVVLLFMMRSIPKLNEVTPELLYPVYALSLIGLSYLSMTLSARLVYPLIAREKRAAWLLFSIPQKRETLLSVKMAFAVLLCLPSLAIGLVAGPLMELPLSSTLLFTLFLLTTTIGVSFTQLFLGTIAPNFLESDNLEATSTSGSGLAAITLSLAVIAVSGIIFHKTITGLISGMGATGLLIGMMLAITVSLFLLARHRLYQYDL